MSTKQLARVEIKDDVRGTVEAVFSTFGVVDSDMDVTRPDAFSDGQKVRISAYGHQSWFGALPVGKGSIRTTDTEAVLEGRFFVDTAAGLDTFKVVKEMGDLQEWSYGYEPVKFSFGEQDGQRVRFLEELSVDEVSPVLKGAGVGTRTLSVKGDMRFGEHAMAVMADVRQLIERASEVMALRAEKGKDLSERSRELIEWLDEDLKRLDALLRSEPDTDIRDEVAREYARFIARTQGAAA